MRLIDADEVMSQCREYAKLLKYDGSTEREWALVKRVMQVIDQQPTVTADPDTVSRQAVYDTLTEYYHHTTEIQHKALREALERVPPSPSRPHGQWIKAKDLSGEYYYCSNCKEELPRVATESATWDNPYPTEYSIDTTDFCPHCGADMRQDRGAV